jgi:hypothetical protein
MKNNNWSKEFTKGGEADGEIMIAEKFLHRIDY